MILFVILLSLYTIAMGAICGRINGGGIPGFDRWTSRILIMIFFVIACAPFASGWAWLALLGVVGIATGHGQYFLELKPKASSGERFDFIVRLFFGREPRTDNKFSEYRDDDWKYVPQEIKDEIYLRMQDYGLNKLYWRCVFGMFVTGTLVGLPAFVLSMAFAEPVGFLFLLTGVVKSLSYMAGYRFWKSTEPAEYMNGGGRNLLCVLVIAFLILMIS